MPDIETDGFRDELLRRLGMAGRKPDADTQAQVTRMLARCRHVACPKHCFAFFPFTRQGDAMILTGTTLRLSGRSIAAHLDGAACCALMAVTLGAAVEREQRALAATSLADAVVFDAVCSAYAEHAANECHAEIARAAAARGLHAAGRFSPGYGDFPIQTQKDLLSVLDAGRRIGITLTDSLLMLPRKSITAVVAIFPGPDGQ